jgi:hypothetical protein
MVPLSEMSDHTTHSVSLQAVDFGMLPTFPISFSRIFPGEFMQ